MKALFVYNSNPAVVAPNSRSFAGLEREDLFSVVHEQVMTDTARYADIVCLPRPPLSALTFTPPTAIFTSNSTARRSRRSARSR